MGGDCAMTTNDQRGELRCWGRAPTDMPVRILCEEAGRVFADTGESVGVLPGERVAVTAAQADRTELPERLDCSVFDEAGNWHQSVTLTTSCAERLDIGDTFGGLQAYAVDSTGAGKASMGTPVTYTYRITNHGASPVLDVTALDSKLGEVPGSPIASLDPGRTVTL
jgi:hypothetical protein